MKPTKRQKRIRRRLRFRGKIKGTAERPRLSVYRSPRYLYAQVIDDEAGKTLVQAQEREVDQKGTKTERAQVVGELLAQRALKKKIKKVIFDKSGYKYHGRVKALAQGARKGGLKF